MRMHPDIGLLITSLLQDVNSLVVWFVDICQFEQGRSLHLTFFRTMKVCILRRFFFFVGFFVENRTLFKRITCNVYMQRYDGVIKCKHAQKLC